MGVENIGVDLKVNINWKGELKKAITKIKTLQPKDRLDYAAELGLIFMYVHSSTTGWLKWLQNPQIIKQFNEKQLKDYFDRVSKNAIELLELDYEATDKYENAIKAVEKPFGQIKGQSYTS